MSVEVKINGPSREVERQLFAQLLIASEVRPDGGRLLINGRNLLISGRSGDHVTDLCHRPYVGKQF